MAQHVFHSALVLSLFAATSGCSEASNASSPAPDSQPPGEDASADATSETGPDAGPPAEDAQAEQPDEPCVPVCDGCCGPDGCGGDCSESCGDHAVCDPSSCACVDTSCGGHDRPTCASVQPAPLDADEKASFVRLNAIPLDCIEAGTKARDFSILESDFEGKSVFMFGEVHGSKELAGLSADIFEFFVRQGLVNALAIEYAMDATDAMNEYLASGGGPLVSKYRLTQYSPNEFSRALMERARLLREDGFEVQSFAVDFPFDLVSVSDSIRHLAEALPPATKAVIVDPLPTPPAGVPPMVAEAFVEEAETYYQHILTNSDVVCPEMGAEDCAHLETLALSLWIGSFANSNLPATSSDAEFLAFLEAREDLIYENYRSHIRDGNDRVYAHMGLAHTEKGSSGYGFSTCGGRLAHDYPLTEGRVFSTRPDVGPGSKISYWGQIENVPSEYPIIAQGLSDALLDVYDVSTHAPGIGCIENPISSLKVSPSYQPTGDAYDAIIYVKLLTPDDGTRSSVSSAAAMLERRAILRHRAAQLLQ